ncbi:hypothetical protein DL96DRAFT_1561308 [Flagelloscypha sp. PMI_526]|nr:hypothetical protein DL96DRAFT_1561308 [Flagelloscypha sp. PMI_526]
MAKLHFVVLLAALALTVDTLDKGPGIGDNLRALIECERQCAQGPGDDYIRCVTRSIPHKGIVSVGKTLVINMVCWESVLSISIYTTVSTQRSTYVKETRDSGSTAAGKRRRERREGGEGFAGGLPVKAHVSEHTRRGQLRVFEVHPEDHHMDVRSTGYIRIRHIEEHFTQVTKQGPEFVYGRKPERTIEENEQDAMSVLLRFRFWLPPLQALMIQSDRQSLQLSIIVYLPYGRVTRQQTRDEGSFLFGLGLENLRHMFPFLIEPPYYEETDSSAELRSGSERWACCARSLSHLREGLSLLRDKGLESSLAFYSDEVYTTT